MVGFEHISADDPVLAPLLFDDDLVFYDDVWEGLGLPNPRSFEGEEPAWLAALHPDGLVFRSPALNREDRAYYLVRIPQTERPALVLHLMRASHAQGIIDANLNVARAMMAVDGLAEALQVVSKP